MGKKGKLKGKASATQAAAGFNADTLLPATGASVIATTLLPAR